MDYKKKYEEALERAKVVNPGTTDYNIVTEIFPELKESKDERVRKELISLVKNYGPQNANPELYQNMLAWLEKQGEQKFPSLSEKEIVCLKRILDFLREEHNSYTGKDFANEIVVLEWLIAHPILIHSSELQQNQGEWKPVWSEEDERISTLCALSVKTRYNDGLLTYNEYEQASLWLNSLKERMKGE